MKDAPKDARAWWNAFENENASRLALPLRLAEKLGRRNATVASFHTTFRLSGVNDVRANLYFLDYRRLKKEKEQKKKAEEERQQREEAREKRRQERVAAAIHRFHELQPMLEADAPAPAPSAEDAAILGNIGRQGRL